MDQVSIVCRRRHFSRRTEEAYRFWIRQYIRFHALKHPRDLGVDGIAPFINFLAVEKNVAASTQSQALNALLFLYRDVLEIQVGRIEGLRRVKYISRIPVVLTVEEVRLVFSNMSGTPRLIAELIYGAGLRVTEAVTLRVKDLDFRANTISVRSGKGSKDRTSLLPLRHRCNDIFLALFLCTNTMRCMAVDTRPYPEPCTENILIRQKVSLGSLYFHQLQSEPARKQDECCAGIRPTRRCKRLSRSHWHWRKYTNTLAFIRCGIHLPRIY